MGGAKAKMMEDEERGFYSGSEKNICHRHLNEPGISDFIINNSILKPCSYCRGTKSMPLDDVMEHIMSCVHQFYEQADLWDDSYSDSEDLVIWGLIPSILPYELQEEIASMLPDVLWFNRNAYYGEDDYLFSDWEFFSNLLKHQMRFVFYKTKVKRSYDGREYSTSAFSILEEIGKTIHSLRLYTKFPLKRKPFMVRARQHTKDEIIKKGVDLSSPPRKRAKSNRFSPAGIPMFYGADEESTAIFEAFVDDDDYPVITTGKFSINRELTLVDLTNLPSISLFDKEKNKFLMAVNFLQRFIEDISKPVLPDGSEHIEYVPTQVVTEYFRFVMPVQYKQQIDGICYNSTKKSGHRCYVLFFDEHQATQNDKEFDDRLPLCLRLSSIKSILSEDILAM